MDALSKDAEMATKVKKTNEAAGGSSDVKAVHVEAHAITPVIATATENSVTEKSSFDNIEWQQRPGRAQGPTKIDVVIAFKKWEVNNNNGKELLTWEGCAELYWWDERLQNYPVAFGMPENIWRPQLMGGKAFNLGLSESLKQLPKFGNNSGGMSDGSVNMKVNFFLGDGGVNLSDQQERFRAFPFDSVRVDKSFQLYNPCKEGDCVPYFDVQFTRPNLKNRLADGVSQHVDWTATRHSDDYDLVNFGYAVGHNPKQLWASTPGSVPIVCLSLQIARAPNFYVHKGIIPLYLVSCFGLLTLSIEPLDLPGRVSVLSALFLTVYAIQWVTIERLPRLPFSTVLDGVAQNVVTALIAIVIGACLSYRLGRPKGGCGLGCLEFDLELAEFIDLIVAVLVVAYLLFYSFLYETIFRAKQIGEQEGYSRRWGLGKAVANVHFEVTDGKAWRLQTTEKWYAKHENKFMGEGTLVNAATW